MARGDMEMRIRLPRALKDWLKSEAIRNVRTQAAEIIVLLTEAQRCREELDAQKRFASTMGEAPEETAETQK